MRQHRSLFFACALVPWAIFPDTLAIKLLALFAQLACFALVVAIDTGRIR